jgi:hypothetical protein
MWLSFSKDQVLHPVVASRLNVTLLSLITGAELHQYILVNGMPEQCALKNRLNDIICKAERLSSHLNKVDCL